jgi:hypothetical protein
MSAEIHNTQTTSSIEEKRIINKTYEFYNLLLMSLQTEEYLLIHTEFIKARSAIRRSDIKSAVRLLTTIFEVASEHDLIGEDIIYPGHGSFDQLSHYLD